ncbi:MAG: NAD(P)H-binding protein [Myxococcota bacterium]|nr:NAD(P)H-binding protein [Myxococcota bacterium]
MAGESQKVSDQHWDALVFGATGYTGEAVVRHLCARGLSVVAHIRPESKSRGRLENQFTKQGAAISVTPWRRMELEALLGDVRPQVIFTLLGTTKSRQREAKACGADPAHFSYDAVDYGLTQLVLELALNSEGLKRFVYLSSHGVGGGARGKYLGARWNLEANLMKSPIPYSIFRPAVITGDDRIESRPAERMAGKLGDCLFSGMAKIGFQGLGSYRSLTSDQLASALVAAAFDASFENRIVSVGDIHSLVAGLVR